MLKGKDGDTQTIYAGPEVKRFDELKVGDTITFRYYESMAYVIRKPGPGRLGAGHRRPEDRPRHRPQAERDDLPAADGNGDDQGHRRQGARR